MNTRRIREWIGDLLILVIEVIAACYIIYLLFVIAAWITAKFINHVRAFL